MRGALLAVLMASVVRAEPPYFFRSLDSERDIGGINENFRATSDAIRDADLTQGGTVDGSLSISGAASGLVFPDGTRQTTAATSGCSVSTMATTTTAYTGLSNTVPVTLAFSTLTYTASGSCYALLRWNCACSAAATEAPARFMATKNGLWEGSMGNNVGFAVYSSNGANIATFCGGTYKTLTKPAAGSTTFTLFIDTDGTSHSVNPATDVCQWEVREVP